MKRIKPVLGREHYSAIIQSLAKLATCPQTDKQLDADVLPRDPVMVEVMRIRSAVDELVKLLPTAP